LPLVVRHHPPHPCDRVGRFGELLVREGQRALLALDLVAEPVTSVSAEPVTAFEVALCRSQSFLGQLACRGELAPSFVERP
jgi:hypothetical protein